MVSLCKIGPNLGEAMADQRCDLTTVSETHLWCITSGPAEKWCYSGTAFLILSGSKCHSSTEPALEVL